MKKLILLLSCLLLASCTEQSGDILIGEWRLDRGHHLKIDKVKIGFMNYVYEVRYKNPPLSNGDDQVMIYWSCEFDNKYKHLKCATLNNGFTPRFIYLSDRDIINFGDKLYKRI